MDNNEIHILANSLRESHIKSMLDPDILNDSLENFNIKEEISDENNQDMQIDKPNINDFQSLKPKSNKNNQITHVKPRPISALNGGQQETSNQSSKYSSENYFSQPQSNSITINTKINTNPFKKQNIDIKQEFQSEYMEQDRSKIMEHQKKVILTAQNQLIQVQSAQPSARGQTRQIEQQEQTEQNPQIDILLQRICKLDDNNKTNLVQLLTKIEKGQLNVEYLLQLDFLFKKNENQEEEVKQDTEQQNEIDSLDRLAGNPLFKQDSTELEPEDMFFNQQNDGQQDEYENDDEYPETINFGKLKFKKTFNQTMESDDMMKPETIKFDKQIQLPIEEEESPRKQQYQENNSPTKAEDCSPFNYNQQTNSDKKIQALEGVLINQNEKIITIRILSTWGSVYQAGLTEIQLFDM